MLPAAFNLLVKTLKENCLHSNNVIDNSHYRLILKLDKGDASKSPQLVRAY
jgi:hypothetical protein